MTWIRSNTHWLIAVVLLLIVSAESYILFKSPEEIQKKSVSTSRIQTNQASTTSTTGTKTSTAEATTQESKKTSKSGSTTRTGQSTKSTRTTTTKKTTRFDPITQNPTEITEETTTTENTASGQKTSVYTETENDSTETTSKRETTDAEKTEVNTTAQTTTVAESTQAEEETVKRGSDNSRLGVGVTSSARIALTYDITRISRYSVSALSEIDPARKKITGIGAGVNADLTRNGRYFAGVYGKYDIPTKSTGITGCVGMRF